MYSIILRITIFITILFFAIGAKAEEPPKVLEEPPKVLEVDIDYTVPLIIKDQPVAAKLILSEGSSIILSSETAERLNVSGRKLGSFLSTQNKFVDNLGFQKQFKLDVGEQSFSTRLVWYKEKEQWNYEAIIGPELIDYDILKMKLNPKRAEEKIIQLAMFDLSEATGIDIGIGTAVEIDNTIILVQFNPSHALNLATAKVGLALVNAFSGHFIENTRLILPEETPTGSGVTGGLANIRLMDAGDVINLGGLEIDRLYIYDSEGQDAKKIPFLNKKTSNIEKDDILVIGTKTTSKDISYPILSIGQQSLKNCSSIEFNKLKKRIYLSCVV